MIAASAKDDKRLAGGRRWFEYHCYEGENSCDAELWHHTHQQVIVLNKLTEVDWNDVGKMYRVRFTDGFEYDVGDDELLRSPGDYTRPGYKDREKRGLKTMMDYAEIRKYAEDNNEPHLNSEELDHVAMCMEHIQKWYYEDYPLGDFLTAVVNNDLMEALFHADDVNIKALKLYAWFITWNIPADWRAKSLKGG